MTRDPRGTTRVTVTAVIPARYGSTRFPGKPLAMLEGKPLFWYAYDSARRCELVDSVVVATDDRRITDMCLSLGVRSVLTGEHQTGTDRVAEAVSALPGDLFINVQGDEPLISTAAITSTVEALRNAVAAGGCEVVNGCTLIRSEAELVSPHCVKVAIGPDSNIVFYSRVAIPSNFRADYPRYRQLGLYGFTRAAIQQFASYPRGPLERAEDVELLRFIEHGHPVQVVDLPPSGPAVDTPEDLALVRAMLSGAD